MQNLPTPNLITLFEENNEVIRLKFVRYHYSTKVKKTKIRFQRYSVAQNILTSNTGERLPIIITNFPGMRLRAELLSAVRQLAMLL